MEQILKEARLGRAELDEGELALVNAQTLRKLEAEEVFTFRLAACDNQVDRDHERFTDETLAELAERYVGRTVLLDHNWSAGNQTARVYAGAVEDGPGEGVKRLVLRCYMLRNEQTASTIAAIEGGILRECSVGLAVRRVLCSICGADQAATLCKHIPGREYDGQVCHMDLDGVADVYEVSLVAVPAQPGAGIVNAGYPAGRLCGTRPEGEGAEGEVRRSHPGRDGEGHAAAGRDRGSQPGGGAAVRVPPHHH